MTSLGVKCASLPVSVIFSNKFVEIFASFFSLIGSFSATDFWNILVVYRDKKMVGREIKAPNRPPKSLPNATSE